MNRLRCMFAVIAVALVPTQPRADVRFEGIDGELLANAQAHLALDDESCDSPAWRVRRLLKKGESEITAALQAYGHYQSVIKSSLSLDTDCWLATYTVSAGAPVAVRKLDLRLTGDAASDAAFQRVVAEARLQTGQSLRHDHYEALKRSLLETAARRGYADAELTRNEVVVFADELAADVGLELDAGRRYNFGATQFEQDVLEPELITRFLPYRRGDPYDSQILAQLYSALAGSGYFDRIEIKPQPDARSDGEIPVRVTLTPGKRRLYTAGLGYSTNTGPRVRAGYNNRRIDARGRQWGTSLLMSNVVSELSANYRQPRGDPRTEWLSLDAGFKHESTDTSNSDAIQLGVRRIKERRNNWRENRFIDLLVEDFEVADDESRSTLIIPGLSWTRTRSGNRLRPERGSRLFLEFRASSDLLGSDTNMLRMHGTAKLIRSLRPRLRVILRAEAGASAIGEFSQLPPSLRFFAGGDSSVRGYAFETLGPADANGNVIGGTGLLVASAEIEQQLANKWSIAAFADSGNAFEDFDLEPKTGAGIGGRWLSPIGPIRLDLARPFNGNDRSVRVHLSFGPDL